MTAKISNIQDKLSEQQRLLSMLAMWDKVKEQGIDPEVVKSFGFDPELMNASDRNQARREARRNHGDDTKTNPFGWPVSANEDGSRVIMTAKFNFVRLKTGEKVKLSPMIDRVY